MTNKKKLKRSISQVLLVGPTYPTAPGTFVAHAKTGDVVITKSLEALKNDWTIINQQVVVLIDETEKKTTKTGFQLDEISFGLAINGKGHIGFFAGVEAGGEASITLTFKRGASGLS
jgi:hypothetical protein